MTHLHAGSVLKLSTPRARTSLIAAALAMSVQVRLRAVRRTRRFASHAALVFVVLAGSALPIQANPIGGNSRDCSKGGSVTEHNFAGGKHHFIMHITDQKGKTLPGGT